MKKSFWLLWSILGLALVFLLDYSALGCEFVYDDLGIIVHNPYLHSRNLFTALSFNPFRSLVYFTYWVQWQLGASSQGFRIFNLLLHFLNGLLLLAFCGRLFEDKPLAGIFASLGLWLNPIFLESVNLISGRFDLMMSFFYLLGLICYLSYSRGWKFRVGFYLALILALLSKEIAVSLPLVCLVLSWREEKILSPKPIFFSILLVLVFIFLRFNWTIILAKTSEQMPGWGEYFLAQNGLFWFSIFKVLIPARLNFDYQLKIYFPLALAGLFFNIFFVGFLFFSLKKRKLFYRLILAGFLIYLPLALIPLADIFRETRIYLFALWIMLVFGLSLSWLGKERLKSILPLLGVIYLCFFSLCWERAQKWRSAESLWRDSVKKSPLKFRPVYNYANALRRKLKLKEAEQVYLWAERLSPSDLRVKTNLELIRRINQNPALLRELEERFKAEQEIP